MCGIAGFWGAPLSVVKAERLLRAMSDRLNARGPDNSGTWIDGGNGLGLAHRRLAIIDLNLSGHQPMSSHDDRYVISFNGEIYNFLDLRTELSGLVGEWRGTSDTEVLLETISVFGLDEALRKAKGMFAFALWDRKYNQLHLIRDRMGEKPLYYGWQGSGSSRCLLFASELDALKCHSAFTATIDRKSLHLYLRHGYVPAPYSIYDGIGKIMPGQCLTFAENSEQPEARKYWDTLTIATDSVGQFSGTPDDCVDQLENLLGDSVEQQMISDVPLGAFLSGGIDSSTVAALMKSRSAGSVKTFTIGFDEPGYNEAEHAKLVASYLGTEHTELYVQSSDAMGVIPRLSTLYSEPFADSSQIPTFLVSQLAKTEVTVALSGDGGDELFCGYNRYVYTKKFWSIIEFMPAKIRSAVSRAILSVSPERWEWIASNILLGRLPNLGGKAHKSANLLKNNSFEELYLSLISIIESPNNLLLSSASHDTFTQRSIQDLENLTTIEKMMAMDSVHYLPDDILTKVDRAAMGVSLETRVPMLDAEVVKFAWSLPLDYKLRHGKSKWPLRTLLQRHVPKKLIERPKVGFAIPVGIWLRGPLREWCETLIAEKRLQEEGYFSVNAVRSLWKEHLSGTKDHGSSLWAIVVFQDWLDHSK